MMPFEDYGIVIKVSRELGYVFIDCENSEPIFAPFHTIDNTDLIEVGDVVYVEYNHSSRGLLAYTVLTKNFSKTSL